MPIITRIALAIFLVLQLGLSPCFAQSPGRLLTNADLISMTKAGLSDDVILGLMKTTPGQYERTPEALVQLKQNGVSNRVIEAVVSGIRDTAASPRPSEQSPSDTLAQLPTTYGYYVLDGNRLVEMPPKAVTTRIGISPGNTGATGYAMDGLEGDPPLTVQSDNPRFLIYQQQVNAQSWHLSSAVLEGDKVAQNFNISNTQPMFFRNVYGVDQNQVVRINLWRPRRAEVPLRVQPIPEKPGMFRLIPEIPLGPGRYILFPGTNVSPEGTVITAAHDRRSWALYFDRPSTASALKPSTATGTGQYPPAIGTSFAAIVTPSEARFILPVPARREWKWGLTTTKDNFREYAMEVAVTNEGKEYNFGFYLWKQPGAVPRTGSLVDLIRAGQVSVFERTDPRRSTLLRGASIKLKQEGDAVIIVIDGPADVRRLFSGHPPEVTFRVEMPGESQLSRSVPVRY